MTLKMTSALAAVVLAAGMACAQAQEETTADTVVAVVDGVEITAGHLILLRGQLPQELQRLPLPDLYDGLIQQAVSQQILSQSLEQVPAAARLTLENQDRIVRANVVMQQIAEAAVTDEALREAYEAEYGDEEPTPEFNAAHILVGTEDEAAALKAELDAGADFGELARAHSTGPSSVSGGELGWFGRGMMVAPFEEAVAALSPGEVSDPVQTQFGWHLVLLKDSREQQPPAFEEVRDALAQDLQQAAVQARLAELRDGLDVKVVDEGEISPAFLDNPDLLSD